MVYLHLGTTHWVETKSVTAELWAPRALLVRNSGNNTFWLHATEQFLFNNPSRNETSVANYVLKSLLSALNNTQNSPSPVQL